MDAKVYLSRQFLTLIMALVFFCFGFFITPTTIAKPFQSSTPTVVDPGYKAQILVPGSYFHGIHGLTFDSQDNLYAGSVVGQSIYHVDTDTGDVIHLMVRIEESDVFIAVSGQENYTETLIKSIILE